MKKHLKRCRREDGSPDPEEESAFFAELASQLADANRYFQQEAAATVQAFRRAVRGFRVCCCYIRLRKYGPRQYAALADRAYWCRKYARANAVALRKILKKHDKVWRNGNGRQFLQRCWCTDSAQGIGLFLHSPLLDELKAVQEVLQRKIEEAEVAMPSNPADTAHKAAAANDLTAVTTTAARPSPGSTQLAVVSSPVASGLPPLHPQTSGLSRQSVGAHSQSSDGLRGAVACGAGSGMLPTFSGSVASVTSPSLRAQRQAALFAIQESPTLMLDSSDLEWEEGEPGPWQLGKAGPAARGAASKQGPLDDSADEDDDGKEDDGIDPDAPWASESARQSSGGPRDLTPPASIPEGGSSGVGPVLGPFRDEDLRCPICLDLMYKPVGLACGHKFCRPCALDAAGFGNVIGAFHNVISYIPARTACPQCRQTGVYKAAVSLKEVGALIRSRYPEQWAERCAEERQRISNSAAELVEPPPRWPRSPYDVLFANM